MALQIGVNVLEIDGTASPALAAAPTSVAAFVGRTRRGVPGQPVRVTDPAALTAAFGAPHATAFTGLAALGFFANGGRAAYVVRVVGAGSGPATRELPDRESTPKPSLRLSGGRRGAADPGDWATDLRIDVRDDGQTADILSATTTSAKLTNPKGIAVGTVVRIGAAFRAVTSVTGDTIGWTGALGAAPTGGTAVTTAEFRLIVRLRDPATGAFPVVETWERLGMAPNGPGYAIDRLNHPATGSRYVMATDLDAGAHPGENVPQVVSGEQLGSAVDNPPTATELGAALAALDTVAVQLLAVPDAHLLAGTGPRDTARAAIDWCAKRGDCLYVGAAPDRAGTAIVAAYVASTIDYGSRLQGTNVYGALYAPWIAVPDPVGAGQNHVRIMPPDGHVLGMYARTELERGIFKAPAGDAAALRGATAVTADVTDAQHSAMVREGSVNGIRALPRRGIVVAASRTLSTDPRWQYVNVRLLFNFVKATLRDGLRFVRQEPHTDALRRSVAFNVITPFLLGLWQQGAFGSDPPAAVFTVKCDAENNPPAQVDLGFFRVDVRFYAARPAETVQIVIGQQPNGATAAEA